MSDEKPRQNLVKPARMKDATCIGYLNVFVL